MIEDDDRKSRNTIIVYSMIGAACLMICALLLLKLSSSYQFAAIKPPPEQPKSLTPAEEEKSLFDRLYGRLTAEVESKIAMVKNRPESQSALGMVDIVNGDSTAAIEKISNAIAAKPDRAELYLQRSVAYITNGMILEGAQDIETAASLNYKYKPLALKCRAIVATLEKTGLDKLLAAHDYSNPEGNNPDIAEMVRQLKESLDQQKTER